MQTTELPKRVLIIEDDPEFRHLLAEILEMTGFVTATSADGLAALEHLKTEERPDVIMLDLMMPRMDGWQFRHEQNAMAKEVASIPVIVMSADGHVSRKAAEIRANGYVMKPPPIAVLLRELQRVIGLPPSETPERVA
jgi:two-component system response regulator MprA